MNFVFSLILILALVMGAQTVTTETPKQKNLQVVVPAEAQAFWKAWAIERTIAEEQYRKMEALAQRIQKTIDTPTSDMDTIKAIKTSTIEYMLRSLDLSSAILDATKEAEKHFSSISSGGSQNELLTNLNTHIAQKGVSQKWQLMLFKEPMVTVSKEKWKKLQKVDPRLTKPLFISLVE